MIKLIRWFIGYVEFTFENGFAEGFLNDCFACRYNLQNIQAQKNGICATCPCALYPRLRKAARANGGSLHIVRRHGFPFYWHRLRGRSGLLLGAFFCVLLISFLSGFVWEIEITGNPIMPETDIRDFLTENGLHEGVCWRSVDKERLESLMMASFEECAWVQINECGTTARVEFNKSVTRPPTVSRKTYYNLKAKKDGIIVKATVYDGWQTAKKGDAVAQGDLLISGIYESEKKKINLFTHARGEYIARVREPFSLRVNRQQTEKIYSTPRRYPYCLLFGLKIPLKWRLKEHTYEEERTYHYLKLNGKQLPLGLMTLTIHPYTTHTNVLSDNELLAVARAETEKKLRAEYAEREILHQELETSLEAENAYVKGYIVCLENIGEEVKIRVHH